MNIFYLARARRRVWEDMRLYITASADAKLAVAHLGKSS